MMVWINWGQQNPNCQEKWWIGGQSGRFSPTNYRVAGIPRFPGIGWIEHWLDGPTRSEPSNQSCWSNHQLKLQIQIWDLTQLILQGIVAGLHTPEYVCEISKKLPHLPDAIPGSQIYSTGMISHHLPVEVLSRADRWLKCWMLLCSAVQPIQSTCGNSP